jgi:hypothetical protein
MLRGTAQHPDGSSRLPGCSTCCDKISVYDRADRNGAGNTVAALSNTARDRLGMDRDDHIVWR